MNAAQTPQLKKRALYLAAGTIAMLFAGVIYAWSLLKVPLAKNFGWSASALTLNFTLTMCTFCLGGFLGGRLAAKWGARPVVAAGGLLAGLGFVLTSRLQGSSPAGLYLCYGVLAGLGIGFAYVTTISTVSAWFPDRKGFCSGCLMMGFGASTLVLGNGAAKLFGLLGWRTTYAVLGIAVGAVIAAAGLILRRLEDGSLPEGPQTTAPAAKETFETVDLTTPEMLKRSSFWRAFLCIVFLAAVGNTVISTARDLALSAGAKESMAAMLVGVLSICNGLGRILTGALFDRLGRRRSMLLANGLTILAACVLLAAVRSASLFLCVLGLCLTGLSYGSNFSVMNFNLMGASFLAAFCGLLQEKSGGYTAPLLLLVVLSVAALLLNLSIRRP